MTATPTITLDTVRQAMALPDFDPIPGLLAMAPMRGRVLRAPEGSEARQAGVLVLLILQGNGPHVVLTRRTAALRAHSGQISFPGGRRAPEDASFVETALRETREELGLCDSPELLGPLSTIYIPPSNFEVFPTVGLLPASPVFQPHPGEVAEVFTVPLHHLLDDGLKAEEEWQFDGYRLPIRFYRLAGHTVWGATAVLLSELEHRLRAALGLPASALAGG